MAKKEKVQEMFNGIAPKYDLLNHLLSMGIDKSWRRKAMKVVGARTERFGAGYSLRHGRFFDRSVETWSETSGRGRHFRKYAGRGTGESESKRLVRPA